MTTPKTTAVPALTQDRLQAVLEWIKTTDLAEVAYHDGQGGFELATGRPPAALPATAPSCRYVPVCASSVGLFQASAPGQPRLGEEGFAVKESDVLGRIETGVGQPHEVRAPCAGHVARTFISGGQPVHYGQLLFFLERG